MWAFLVYLAFIVFLALLGSWTYQPPDGSEYYDYWRD